MENEEQMPVEETSSEAEPTPDLNVTDLVNIRAIIDAAVRRGTFSASEISGVGAAYDKLDKFLNAVSKQENK